LSLSLRAPLSRAASPRPHPHHIMTIHERSDNANAHPLFGPEQNRAPDIVEARRIRTTQLRQIAADKWEYGRQSRAIDAQIHAVDEPADVGRVFQAVAGSRSSNFQRCSANAPGALGARWGVVQDVWPPEARATPPVDLSFSRHEPRGAIVLDLDSDGSSLILIGDLNEWFPWGRPLRRPARAFPTHSPRIPGTFADFGARSVGSTIHPALPRGPRQRGHRRGIGPPAACCQRRAVK
jgi:hypothetical protein